MKTIVALSLVALLTGCAYSHIASTVSTFQQPTTGAPLQLCITRHLDTVIRGPDDEEDQTLVLNVRDFRLNQKLKIPSENVTPEFTVTRFGPHSTGKSYTGYLVVRKVTADEVDAALHLDVVARTESASYTQTAKFHGNFKFVRLIKEQ
ncbi:MAG TPA: hypothetical protein VL171_17250 [Verrucomicrobiae bacterium]|nr:hypothetical protein [Verrucomicrobiae bacterium]